MAEFCLECFKKMYEGSTIKINDKKVVLSKEEELCEGCEQWKKVVWIVLLEYEGGNI